MTPAKIEKSISPATKPGTPKQIAKKLGKKLPGVTKILVETKLLPGQRVTTKALAEIIDVTPQGIRSCRNAGKLGEWKLKLVPESKPELFERI